MTSLRRATRFCVPVVHLGLPILRFLTVVLHRRINNLLILNVCLGSTPTPGTSVLAAYMRVGVTSFYGGLESHSEMHAKADSVCVRSTRRPIETYRHNDLNKIGLKEIVFNSPALIDERRKAKL